MGDGRKVTKTKWPGIYEVSRLGSRPRYMVSYRLPGIGQRTKTLPTITEAKRFQGGMRDPTRAKQAAQLESRGKVSLADYFDTFLERRRNLTPSTRERYVGIGRLYIKPSRLGRMSVASIARDDVEDWITGMQRAGVGLPTIDKAHRVLRVTMESAVAEGKALANPAKRITTPEQEHREPFFLTADQVDAIANDVPARHRALVYFLAYTGVRIGEASALRIVNVDLPRRRILIAENSAEVSGRKITGHTKTKHVRAIELSEALCYELASHIERFVAKQPDGQLDPGAFVFTHGHGGQIRQNAWRARVFQTAAARVGILRPGRDGLQEPPRVHDLRHTAASLAAQAGFALYEVKDMLGHSTIKTTADLYLHLFPDGKREKANRLGDLMDEARRDGASVTRLARA